MKYTISLIALALVSQVNSVAVPEGLPAAFAAAAASYQCHSYCGNAIIESRTCSSSSGYDTDCLCATNSNFMGLINDCLDCAWCLWSDYGKYLEAPLAACKLSTSPTGSECAPGASVAETTAAKPTTAETTAAKPTTSAAPTAAETTVAKPAETTDAKPAETSVAKSAETSVAKSAEASVAKSSQTSAAPSAATSTTPQVSSYSGAASKQQVGGAILAGVAALLI